MYMVGRRGGGGGGCIFVLKSFVCVDNQPHELFIYFTSLALLERVGGGVWAASGRALNRGTKTKRMEEFRLNLT